MSTMRRVAAPGAGTRSTPGATGAAAASDRDLLVLDAVRVVLALAGTPAAIIDKLQRKIASIYADPAMVERLEKVGISPTSSTPAEFDAFIRIETVRWAKVFAENSHLKLAD